MPNIGSRKAPSFASKANSRTPFDSDHVDLRLSIERDGMVAHGQNAALITAARTLNGIDRNTSTGERAPEHSLQFLRVIDCALKRIGHVDPVLGLR